MGELKERLSYVYGQANSGGLSGGLSGRLSEWEGGCVDE